MSKVLSSDDSTEVERWELPDVSQQEEIHYSRLLTAEQIEEIQKQAYDEGYQQGFDKGEKEGYQSGEQEVNQKLDQMRSLIGFLEAPLTELDQEVVQQLLEMTTIIAGQVIRRELRADPGQVIAVVRECVKNLPIATRKISIQLHPDDASLVREAFSLESDMEQSWQVVEDPLLTRGGCRIEAENSKIDATVEQQLNRVIANLMGGEREADAE